MKNKTEIHGCIKRRHRHLGSTAALFRFASLLMAHLSRFAEDLIIYTSFEFGFVKLSDAYVG